jgi:hypothetical protein
VLANGKVTSAAEIEVSAPVVAHEFVKIGSIQYSAGKDFAFTTFWAKEGEISVVYTGVFSKHVGKWFLATAQKAVVV